LYIEKRKIRRTSELYNNEAKGRARESLMPHSAGQGHSDLGGREQAGGGKAAFRSRQTRSGGRGCRGRKQPS
jgi:hypothetical protein